MHLTRDTNVSSLPGVGPKKGASLGRLGIKTIDDLVHHFPSRWYFAPPITQERPAVGEQVTYVSEVAVIYPSDYRRRTLKIRLDNWVDVTWFNGQYIRQQVFKGSRIMVSGKMGMYGLTNPAFKVLKPDEVPNPADLNSVEYPVTKGVTSKDISRWVRSVLNGPLGAEYPHTIHMLHSPAHEEEKDYAIDILKYEELFYMQLGLAYRQAQRDRVPTNVQCTSAPLNLRKYFPYLLTRDQQHAIDSILIGMSRNRSMNRLLQGDVGSGKTAVAAYAAILMAMNGGQTAILCPTEILARQHYKTIKGYFDQAGLNCILVTGSAPKIRGIECKYVPSLDKTHIMVGTTALLRDIQWDDLGLVIVDEQHKFGVEQRASLRKHGNPHCLVMTATPIPRTIAMTAFGDLDVSTLKTMPPGRLPVYTKRLPELDGFECEAIGARSAAGVIRGELSKGRQIYVVCPRIEALDDEMRAVEEVVEEYRRLFPDAIVERLHGKMSKEHRREVETWWSQPHMFGRILVSTTVVEVGVDNPNATVMVIEGAERFGLAQLHQLRGRVGRSEHQSYCFLLSDSDSSDARSRMRIMERTNDGFEIAEEDLRLRGPGDLLSTRQHGLPDLRLADLLEDYDLMLEARNDAKGLIEADPELVEHEPDMKELQRRFGDRLLLGDMG